MSAFAAEADIRFRQGCTHLTNVLDTYATSNWSQDLELILKEHNLDIENLTQRLACEIRWTPPQFQEIPPQRLRNVRLTGGNVVLIVASRTCPGLVGGSAQRTGLVHHP
jgi:hypothetical protein